MVQHRKRPARWSGGRRAGMALLALLAVLLAAALGTTGALYAQDAGEANGPETVVLPPLQLYIPAVQRGGEPQSACPQQSDNTYASVPVQGARSAGYPPVQDPDLNLAVRSYLPISTTRELIAINGPTDEDAPQLAALFRPRRVPAFTQTYRVYGWDWECAASPAGRGCRGKLIAEPAVTALGMATEKGEALYPPDRQADIYAGRYVALVLYAETQRVTLAYTREDSPAWGYIVHLENFCVDPNLLARYQADHRAGRAFLPALGSGESVGTGLGHALIVAVRDTGSFMDPRSAKDWWQDTVRALRAGAVDP